MFCFVCRKKKLFIFGEKCNRSDWRLVQRRGHKHHYSLSHLSGHTQASSHVVNWLKAADYSFQFRQHLDFQILLSLLGQIQLALCSVEQAEMYKH